MKSVKFISVFLLMSMIGNQVFGQVKIEWRPDLEVAKSSFQGQAPVLPVDHLQQYYFAGSWDFAFLMPNVQLMFTKNFNKYVETYFIPEYSWIEEGELTGQIIAAVNLDFDILELYARKYRQRLYDAKKVGSNLNFFQREKEALDKEYIAFAARVQSEITSSEYAPEVIARYSEEVNEAIKELDDFCRECKPKARKKAKK